MTRRLKIALAVVAGGLLLQLVGFALEPGRSTAVPAAIGAAVFAAALCVARRGQR